MAQLQPYRIACLLALLALAPRAEAAGRTGEDHSSDRDESATLLTSVELREGILPHEDAIGACYKTFALPATRSTGELRLELIVHRDGNVFRLNVVAPGVPKKKMPALTRCIEKSARNWHFAPRKGFTHAVIPFLYQRTHAKGAGPLRSCWSPSGCRDLHRPPQANKTN